MDINADEMNKAADEVEECLRKAVEAEAQSDAGSKTFAIAHAAGDA